MQSAHPTKIKPAAWGSPSAAGAVPDPRECVSRTKKPPFTGAAFIVSDFDEPGRPVSFKECRHKARYGAATRDHAVLDPSYLNVSIRF
jgi:hypothetical protein